MAKLTEGQTIIFKHPVFDFIRAAYIKDGHAHYVEMFGHQTCIPCSLIQEWCDAEAAWNALTLQQVRTGNFEWSECPTIEPETT